MVRTRGSKQKASSGDMGQPGKRSIEGTGFHGLIAWLRDLMPAFLCLGAAVLIGSAFFFPLWTLKLYAPQYPAGPLTLYVYPYKLEEQYEDVRGEIFELKLLSETIGSRFPARPPELAIVPVVFGLAVLVCLTATFFQRRRKALLKAAVLLLLLTMVAGAAGLQWRLYDFGHNRNPHAPLRDLPVFTVPLVGSSRFANWKTFSRPEMGAYALPLAAIFMGMAYWQQTRLKRTPC